MEIEAIKAQRKPAPHTHHSGQVQPGAVSMKTLPQEQDEHQYCPLHNVLSEAGEANWEGTEIGSVGKIPNDFP